MSQLEIKQALFDASTRLEHYVEQPTLEAEILLAHILGEQRSYLYTWPEKVLGDKALRALRAAVDERCAGKPISYITGYKEFWSLPFKVTPDVLIPRPATEAMLEEVLTRLSKTTAKVADLGTGSGAIAIALAHERPAYEITGVDISKAALTIAKDNAARLNIKNVKFVLGDWCAPLKQTYHAIISNPPYIANNDPHLKNSDISFEPIAALTSGADGLQAIRSIAKDAKQHLVSKGMLVLEHGFEQQAAVKEILIRQGYENISGHRDSDGLPRFVVSYRN